MRSVCVQPECMGTTDPATLPAHILRAVAVDAEVDPRTVRRLLQGERVLPLLEARIRRALAHRGLADGTERLNRPAGPRDGSKS